MFENFKKSQGKNERTCERIHVQNRAYADNSKPTYVRDVLKLSNPNLEQRVVSSASIAISQITSSGRSLISSRKSVGPRIEP